MYFRRFRPPSIFSPRFRLQGAGFAWGSPEGDYKGLSHFAEILYILAKQISVALFRPGLQQYLKLGEPCSGHPETSDNFGDFPYGLSPPPLSCSSIPPLFSVLEPWTLNLAPLVWSTPPIPPAAGTSRTLHIPSSPAPHRAHRLCRRMRRTSLGKHPRDRLP